jgi:hypothetical protein
MLMPEGTRVRLNANAGRYEGEEGSYLHPCTYVPNLHWIQMDNYGPVRVYLPSCFDVVRKVDAALACNAYKTGNEVAYTFCNEHPPHKQPS